MSRFAKRLVPVATASYGAYAYCTEDFLLLGPRRGCIFWATAGPLFARYAIRDFRGESVKDLHQEGAQKAIDLILRLQGFYIKVGQFMSARPEILPDEYIEKLRPLRDDVPARGMEEIRDTLERELRQPMEEVFESFEKVPLGAASIGQVHRAVLKHGTEVCVKVQYSDVRKQFHVDLMCVTMALRLMGQPYNMMRDLKDSFMLEFDYQREARSLTEVADNMSKAPFADRVAVPRPIRATNMVLIMEFLKGRSLETALKEDMGEGVVTGGLPQNSLAANMMQRAIQGPGKPGSVDEHGSDEKGIFSSRLTRWLSFVPLTPIMWTARFLRWLGILPRVKPATGEVLDLLLQVHGHQIFVDGCFQGDPHPGNFLLMDDGRLGLLDFGQTIRFNFDQRQRLGALVTAVYQKDDVVPVMKALGVETANNDRLFQETLGIFLLGSLRQVRELIAREQGTTSIKSFRRFFQDMRQRDTVVQFPTDYYMAIRSATLLRGLGMILGHSVDPAASWAPFVPTH